ncbi:MAG: hypothetical protein KA288_09035 [Paludibacteraceae bacterium]|nr:hypothetical protein [Paludibacteraceae bacterium]
MSALYNSNSNLDEENLIAFLANGSKVPSDGKYIDAYNEVFEILKTIFQGSSGYPNFIKKRNVVSPVANKAKLDKLTKKAVLEYLNALYDDLVIDKKKNYSDYVEQASLDLYSAVLGQERVVLSHIESNLQDFKKSVSLDPEKQQYVEQLISIFQYGSATEKAFLYTMIGKVLEGSLSQARKSIGGNLAEKIIHTLLEKQRFDVKSQDGSETATNTDLVVTTDQGKHCIAVQLSTNDRMRLSTDEYGKDSTNYLVSLNGCTVSKKSLTDISLQRMSTWMRESIEDGKVIPFYVGRDSFIEKVRDLFQMKFLDEIKPYITEENWKRIDFSKETLELVQHICSEDLNDYPVKIEQLKTSMYLALWAKNCTLSFEDFINKLR